MEFDASFEELHRAAYRVAYKVLGDRAEAQDIAQEALARCLVRWKTVSDYAPAWVSRVAANLAIDVVRRDRRSAVAPDELTLLDPDSAQRLDLQRALLSLPRRQRDVVVLRYLLDLSERSVADALGVSTGSIKTHASRGLAALRLSLGQARGA
ncbi:MAG: putative polymerase subfamily sigma factor [Frankiales bacterium]|nr:putative polymerase subfamily sigma factor [Frankiales bacterium]